MKRKIFKIAIVVMLLVCVYATIVNALSFSVTMTPSSKFIPASTEFTVEIKVSNLDVGTNGINTLSGNLIYDDKVFEPIGESSIEGRNGWSHSFNPDNGKITLTKMSFVKTDEEVFQVTFKTKSSTDVKDNTKGLIQFKGVSASNSASAITASDVSIEITIGEEASSEGNISVTPNNTTNTNKNTTNTNKNSIGITPSNPNKNTTNTNTNSNTNANTNKSTNSNTNTNKAVSPYVNSTNTTNENIPYTGAEDYILYFIGAVVAVAIVFYIKFERINKEMK